MSPATIAFVLRGAHVIDAEQGIDGIADVHVADGKVEFVGSREIARFRSSAAGLKRPADSRTSARCS